MDPTSNDFEARRTIWDSKIPVEFALDSSESVLATQQSCFMMLPRASYFPVYLDKALRILTGGDASEEQLLNAWLQYDGQVLKWHYPIGVLYDIAHGTVFDQTSPWTIIVHLKNFPDELIRCRTKETLKFYFLQSLKEACQLKHRHNIASSMTKDEHARLFDGLYNERFNDFWEVNERLMSFKSPIGGDEFGKIPARFYEVFDWFELVTAANQTKQSGIWVSLYWPNQGWGSNFDLPFVQICIWPPNSLPFSRHIHFGNCY
ncbi:autophagy protein 5, variant 2 [Globodera pallida]|nr:autophagy protein 5, variant 2 [Globodera pallida]